MARRRWKWMLAAAAVAAALGAAGLYAVYRAARRVPQFYQQALSADSGRQAVASDEMVRKTAALASDIEKQGRWQAEFTAEQINGWLAVDLEKNHPGLLPSGIEDPRVVIEKERLTAAARFKWRGTDGVVWLTTDVYLAEPNVIAVRLTGVHAGLVPMPMGRVLDVIRDRAAQHELPLKWKQADGDPVALITVTPPAGSNGKRIVLENITIDNGRVFLSGTTLDADSA